MRRLLPTMDPGFISGLIKLTDALVTVGASQDAAFFRHYVERLPRSPNQAFPTVSEKASESTPLPDSVQGIVAECREKLGLTLGWPAIPWELPDSTGELLSNANYESQPQLLIFYLGTGCAHCQNQLNTFAPLAEQFKEIGIGITAISIDSIEGLKKMDRLAKEERGPSATPFPFPVVSNQNLTIFRACGAYDAFDEACF